MSGHLYAILSDIHANYPALLAVADDARQLAHDEHLPTPIFVCLGDIVDYGPQPNECMDWVRAHVDEKFLLRGNHDDDVSRPGWTRPQRIGEFWWPLTLWTRFALAPHHHETLRRLPEQRVGMNSLGRFTLSHSWPPSDDDYLYDPSKAREALQKLLPDQFALFGHSHRQVMFENEPNPNPQSSPPWRTVTTTAVSETTPSGALRHESGTYPTAINDWRPLPRYRALINPGSVGQPRFAPGDPTDCRAQYMLLDTTKAPIRFQWRRVKYHVEETLRQYEGVVWPVGQEEASPASNENGASSSSNERDVLWRDDHAPVASVSRPEIEREGRARLGEKLPGVIQQLKDMLRCRR